MIKISNLTRTLIRYQLVRILYFFDKYIVDVLIKLRAKNDPGFKVDFHVDFSNMELIARDVRKYWKCYNDQCINRCHKLKNMTLK